MSKLEPMFKKQVGIRVEKLRKAINVGTQGEMAKKLGATTGTYNHWTTGQALITVPAANRLCTLSGATLDYIYRGEISGLPMRLITLLSEPPEQPSEKSRPEA